MEYLKIDDFKKYATLGNLRYSPSGGSSAIVVGKGHDKNGYYKTIYVDKGNGYFPLTSAKGNVGLYAWLDDENIIFAETRSKDVQEKLEKGFEITSFHKININGGEAVAMFDVDAIVTGIELLPNNSFLMTVLHDNARPDLNGKTPAEAEVLLKEFKKSKSFQVVDELPYWFNGRGFVNKKRSRLCTYSVQDGLKHLTQPLDEVSAYKLSPCGCYILFTGDIAPFDIHDIKTNLYLLDIKSCKVTEMLKERMFIKAFDFAGDSIVLAATDGKKYNFHEHPSFYLMSMNGEMKHLLDYDLSIGSSGNTDSRGAGGFVDKFHDGCFYFISLHGFKTDVFKLCLTSGTLENVTNCGGNVHFFDISGSKMLYGAMKGMELQEVYETQKHLLGIVGVTTKKSSFNSEVLANKKLSTPEYHTIRDKDGYEVDGWVIKPVDYDPAKSYPAILNIHGGPKTAYCESFFHEMQYFANQNYFVLFCNPRGSDGKGNDFAEIRGRYGSVDYDNLIQFTDEMCAKYPAIDTSKLGVMGGSYGGYMTNWIVGHTNKFAAAASMRGICNWVSMAYVSDIGSWFVADQVQADAWNNHDKMWDNSPLKYAPNVKTPTLILHSDEDFRCWIPEAYQWFTALKLHGVETRMHIFHGENHELSRSGKPDSRVRRFEEIQSWMDKYLKA